MHRCKFLIKVPAPFANNNNGPVHSGINNECHCLNAFAMQIYMYVINCNLQRMLEKAEQRSRALGITNASKFPLSECSISTAEVPSASVSTSKPTLTPIPTPTSICSSNNSQTSGKVVILEKTTLEASPSKPLRHYAAVNKENMEMGIEINITTAQPIGVSSFCRFIPPLCLLFLWWCFSAFGFGFGFVFAVAVAACFVSALLHVCVCLFSRAVASLRCKLKFKSRT